MSPIKYIRFLILVIFTLKIGIASAATYPKIQAEVDLYESSISQVPSHIKFITIANAMHRSGLGRDVVVRMIEGLSIRFPKEKICLFLETTPKVDPAWVAFKGSDGSEDSYDKYFKPIAKTLSEKVKEVTVERAARTFIEPSFEMATYLRERIHSQDLFNIYGVDVDYTFGNLFSTFYHNQHSYRRTMSDDEFAQMFIGDRNREMAKNISERFADGDCERGILDTGNAHAYRFVGGDRTFPEEYTGPLIDGIPNLVSPLLKEEPYIIYLTKFEKYCPENKKAHQCIIGW